MDKAKNYFTNYKNQKSLRVQAQVALVKVIAHLKCPKIMIQMIKVTDQTKTVMKMRRNCTSNF